MLCAIWYHLYNLKNVKNTYEGKLLKVTLHHVCFTRFLNCTKWYQVAQSITNKVTNNEISKKAITSGISSASVFTGNTADSFGFLVSPSDLSIGLDFSDEISLSKNKAKLQFLPCNI